LAWFFSHDEIPEGRTLPLSPMGAFFPAKKKAKKIYFVFFSVFQKKY
jgi:hypothetical protein